MTDLTADPEVFTESHPVCWLCVDFKNPEVCLGSLRARGGHPAELFAHQGDFQCEVCLSMKLS